MTSRWPQVSNIKNGGCCTNLWTKYLHPESLKEISQKLWVGQVHKENWNFDLTMYIPLSVTWWPDLRPPWPKIFRTCVEWLPYRPFQIWRGCALSVLLYLRKKLQWVHPPPLVGRRLSHHVTLTVPKFCLTFKFTLHRKIGTPSDVHWRAEHDGGLSFALSLIYKKLLPKIVVYRHLPAQRILDILIPKKPSIEFRGSHLLTTFGVS